MCAVCTKIHTFPATQGQDASCKEHHFERQGKQAGVVHHDGMANTVKVVHCWDGDGCARWKMGAQCRVSTSKSWNGGWIDTSAGQLEVERWKGSH